MISQMIVKEVKEIVKSYKIILVPLIFIGVLLMQPIVFKMLPDIMENGANLPAGAVIEMGEIKVTDVLGSILGQFEQIGVVAIILFTMGTIVEERASGVVAMVLVKPIGREKYYFSKVIIYSILIALSFFLAMGVCGYYTEILYGGVVWSELIQATGVYLVNLFLVISIVFFLSTFLKKQLAVAAISFLSYFALVQIPKYLGDTISAIGPNNIVDSANKLLVGIPDVEYLKPVLSVFCLSIVILIAGWQIFKRQEF